MLEYLSYEFDRVYLRSDISVKEGKIIDTKVITNNDGNDYELFIKDTNIPGLYTYGSKQLEDSEQHEAGYIWPSRASVMNRFFGVKFLEGVIGEECFAIDADTLQKLIESQGRECTVDKEFFAWDTEKREPHYRLNMIVK